MHNIPFQAEYVVMTVTNCGTDLSTELDQPKRTDGSDLCARPACPFNHDSNVFFVHKILGRKRDRRTTMGEYQWLVEWEG